MLSQAIDVSAGGTFMVGSGTRHLVGASLRAAAANATLTIRENDGAGRKLAVLACVAGTTDQWTPTRGVAFQGQIFVVITGVGAEAIACEG